jgi:hypothetical protein
VGTFKDINTRNTKYLECQEALPVAGGQIKFPTTREAALSHTSRVLKDEVSMTLSLEHEDDLMHVEVMAMAVTSLHEWYQFSSTITINLEDEPHGTVTAPTEFKPPPGSLDDEYDEM